MPGSIHPLPIMEEQAQEQKAEQPLPETVVVRYGYTRQIAELTYGAKTHPGGCGSKLVIRTDRGIELAEMLTTTCEQSSCSSSISRKQMLEYFEASGGKEYPFSENGKVLRVATLEDVNEQARLDGRKAEMLQTVEGLVREMDLQMKLVDVELLLGGERIVFYYVSEEWVDFRELVRRLATEYQTRIEMRQVNARDEARLVADYEKCGQHCCCRQFLKVLKPVSMKAAKIQKATLDPTKISGRCGRLMCCLRYEQQTYDQLRKKLPNRKRAVLTEDGVGIVMNTQILTQLVMVQLKSTGKMAAFPVEETELLDPKDPRIDDATVKLETAKPEQSVKPHREQAGKDEPVNDLLQEMFGDKLLEKRKKAGQSSGDAASQDEEKGSGKEGTDQRSRRSRSRRSRRRRNDGDKAGKEQQTKGGEGSNQPQAGKGEAKADASSSGGDGAAKKKKRRRRRRRRKSSGDSGSGGGEG